MKEKGRLIAIGGYLTPVGWLVGLILNLRDRTDLGSFHLRQSLLLHITGLIILLLQFAVLYVPVIGKPVGLLLVFSGMMWLFFWAAGLVSAFGRERYPLPFFGKASQRIFPVIK